MPTLKPDTPLARFIFSQDDVRADGKPRPGPFKPRKGDALSVYDIEGLDHLESCQHGHEYADDPKSGRVHIGYAAIVYRIYTELGLSGVYDNHPPRHVSIGPTDPDEYRREISKALAAQVKVSMCAS
jgi:hypothetical protein